MAEKGNGKAKTSPGKRKAKEEEEEADLVDDREDNYSDEEEGSDYDHGAEPKVKKATKAKSKAKTKKTTSPKTKKTKIARPWDNVFDRDALVKILEDQAARIEELESVTKKVKVPEWMKIPDEIPDAMSESLTSKIASSFRRQMPYNRSGGKKRLSVISAGCPPAEFLGFVKQALGEAKAKEILAQMKKPKPKATYSVKLTRDELSKGLNDNTPSNTLRYGAEMVVDKEGNKATLSIESGELKFTSSYYMEK